MALSDAVIEALSPQVEQQTIKLVTGWLKDNKEIAATIASLALGGNGLSSAVESMRWLATKITDGKTPPTDPTSALNLLPIEQASEVVGAFALTERLTGAEPGRNLREVDGKLEVVRPERRLGLGVTRVNGRPHPIVLLASGGDKLPDWATRDLGSLPKTLVVGQAAATIPQDNTKQPALTVPKNQHRPGRSVGHHRYNAGSIGAYVRVEDDELERPVLGFLSASHVLSEMGRASRKDRLLSPGYPDCGPIRDGKFTYGTLARWSELIHYATATQADLIVNRADVALGYLDDDTLRVSNEVPDPNAPSKALLPMTDHMTLVQMRDHTKQEVFIVGRTTSFGHGTLEATDILEFPIKMPNGKNYMFGGLALVQSSDPERRFSQGGDSGAVVYALKGNQCKAVGFIVGGSETHSYIVPADLCLTAMEASLL
ncbi:hypothetical protein FTO74_06415 [Granulicella sp. WH15]|uniref:hypothetical protein n=1 Tax=Granulicella sp. WH15 TaxID=2602070 RepID=UPI00136781A8|nr:hypothetical protein [Granulicella sp. WH15]QHN03044.1 hypothetical protein FTO74_06415 [Granulicella sp. WH15]